MAKTIMGPRYTAVERFKLMTFISEKYAISGMSDARFATLVQAELGLQVTNQVIAYYRKMLEIPSNTAAPVPATEARLKELEEAYVSLADEVKDLKQLVVKMQESCRLAGVKMAP